MDKNENISKKDVEKAARTLGRLDNMVESFYNKNHAKAVEAELPGGESAISEMARELTERLPGQIMIANGNGYCIFTSLFINMLMSCNRQDLANWVIEMKIKEQKKKDE